MFGYSAGRSLTAWRAGYDDQIGKQACEDRRRYVRTRLFVEITEQKSEQE